jgi:hypothetical protein
MRECIVHMNMKSIQQTEPQIIIKASSHHLSQQANCNMGQYYLPLHLGQVRLGFSATGDFIYYKILP